MFEKLKVEICTKLLSRNGQFMLMSVMQRPDRNFQCCAFLSTRNDVLEEAWASTMETHKEIREFVLKIAENYLSRREIDGRNFAERILAK